MFECWEWVGVWMGVGRPRPPVHNNIVYLLSTTNIYKAKVRVPNVLSCDTEWFLKHVAVTVNSIFIWQEG